MGVESVDSTSAELLRKSVSGVTIVTLTLLIPLVLCIVVGNWLVILAVFRNPELRTPSNLILTSLAVSDFLTSFSFVLEMYQAVINDFAPCLSSVTAWLSFPWYVSSGVSFLHIVILTGDRYIAVNKPFEYHRIVTTGRVWLSIVMIWAVNIVFNVVRLSIPSSPDNSSVTGIWCEGDPYREATVRAMNWTVVVLMCAVFLALVWFHARILKTAIRHANIIERQRVVLCREKGVQEIQTNGRGRLKAVKTTALIVGIFILCWCIVPIYHTIRLTTTGYGILHATCYTILLVMYGMSSAVNPFIYCYRYPVFRQTFKDILLSVLKRISCGQCGYHS